ncbi:MAG: SipW-dependent-type signal peptide-containing protein [Candidatus Daviesbacteria bacterium]|nr:SipW-dependent-type signal peptide-containing protein [Candidatus Daviesbacteria bacterium]
MKRIIFAAVVATVSLSLVAVTTWAAWTSSVTVSNNVITTGSVNLNVSLNGTNYSKAVSSNTTISGLMPGGSNIGTVFYIRNDSSDGVNFNLGAVGTGTISGDTQPVDTTSLQIAVVTHGATPVDANYHSLSEWSTNQSLGTLNAGASQQYDVYARLSGTAADDWQGRTVTFAFTVTGTQL